MINRQHPICSATSRPRRHGTTLIEVLFSIGVVLIGLVGLVAIIPVAGRRAEDSVALNTGSALAASASSNLISRGLADRLKWTWLNDISAPLGAKAVVSSTAPLPPAATTGARCLDPLFLSSPKTLISESASPPGYFITHSATGTNGYRRSFFPYYKANYNPLVDPSSPVTSGNQWPTTPRMLRVSVDRPVQAGAQFLRAKEAELVVESGDGISQAKPEDDTLDSVAVGHAALGTGGYGKRTTSGKYTWFATFNQIPGTGSAEVCTVIMRSRDRSYYTPPSGSLPAATDEDNASSERLAYVAAGMGFSGGAGGTVTIVASDKTKSKITSNDWVMLSRNVGGTGIHQWYRVSGAIGDAERIEGYTDPQTSDSRNVWQRQIMLDGPDWDFSTLTVMTIVEDVVSVSRRTIPFTP